MEKDPGQGLNAAVAAELRAERAALEITTEVLAERSGVPPRTLYRLLNAQRLINLATLELITAGLKVSPAEIVDRAVVRMSRPSWNQEGDDPDDVTEIRGDPLDLPQQPQGSDTRRPRKRRD